MTRLMLIGKRGLASLAIAATLISGCGDDGGRGDVAELETDTAAAKAAAVDVGTVSGRITLSGAAPELQPFAITANADVCGTAAKSNLLSVDAEGGISGAVVWIEAIGAAPIAAPQTMDQIGCQYSPHAVATTVGSVVRFANNDPAPHNVRVEDLASGGVKLNIAQPNKGRADEWTVSEVGAYFVGCDYHPWMNAYIVAVPSGFYAVTGPDGRYSISNVPVGAHSVTVWHNGVTIREKRDTEGKMIGYKFDEPITRTESVAVTKNATATLDVSLSLGDSTMTSRTP